MGKIITFVTILFSWIIFGLSFCFPRNKKIWIFVGWYKSKERETFADNSKYVFLEVANNHKDIRAIWIGSDEKICTLLRAHGYEAYTISSCKGIWYSLRAKYTIIDAVMKLANWRYSGGSVTMQLWHADGIKNLTFTHSWSWQKFNQIFFAPGSYKNFNFFIASSPYIAKNFICPSFDVTEDKVRITGLPRYDAFWKEIPGGEIDVHEKLKADLAGVQAKNPEKILFYGPTFRRGTAADSPLAQLDMEALNEFLKKENYFMFISMHPKFSATDWLPTKAFSNILFTNADYDIYPLLPQFDMVITDYSSTCLEFLLQDKPAIFFVYDFESYSKDPGIPEEFWNMVPGPRVRTFPELLDAIKHTNQTTLQEERKKARDILFTFEKGKASENVVQAILTEPVK